jgi:hypothetical protein
MLTVCFAVISLLYATVGQAGGTAFLALMAFASFPSNEMRPARPSGKIFADGFAGHAPESAGTGLGPKLTETN